MYLSITAIILITSCKKDDNDDDNENKNKKTNSFTYLDKEYPTPFGYLFRNPDDDSFCTLWFTDKAFDGEEQSYQDLDYRVKLNIENIVLIDNKIPTGEYNIEHIEDGILEIKEIDFVTDFEDQMALASLIINADQNTFEYEIKLTDGLELKGYFKGELHVQNY